jgi:hypothetical protein
MEFDKAVYYHRYFFIFALTNLLRYVSGYQREYFNDELNHKYILSIIDTKQYRYQSNSERSVKNRFLRNLWNLISLCLLADFYS